MRIESPCHENFSKMDKRANGRFCSSCEKVVIDLTNMSNEQIAEHLKKQSSSSICIRAKSFQLENKNRYEKFIYTIRERMFKISFTPARLAFLGLLSGLAVFTSSCMGKKCEPIGPSYDAGQKDSLATKQHNTPQKK